MKPSVIFLALLLVATAYTNDYTNCLADIHQVGKAIDNAIHTHHVDPLSLALGLLRSIKDCENAIKGNEIPQQCKAALQNVVGTVQRDIKSFEKDLTKAALLKILADLKTQLGPVETACDKPAPQPSPSPQPSKMF